MLFLAVMVAVCAILGSLAMGMMFDSRHIPDDLMTNGQYYAFQKLGEYYHMGNSLMVIYAIANTLGQIAALVFSIDAPLKYCWVMQTVNISRSAYVVLTLQVRQLTVIC